MSEDQFQQAVTELCDWRHLLWFHDHDSRRNPSGFPDLVIVSPWGVLFRELKTDTGRIRPDQKKWLAVLQLAGADADVWRPADMPRVVAELTALATGGVR